tara:strand:+ start:147 stop:311 length:165 start_codon:yes stop_codon:yes gene_type:complete
MAFWVANVVLYDPAAALTRPSQLGVDTAILSLFYKWVKKIKATKKEHLKVSQWT